MSAASRQRRGRPETPALLVADVERLAAGVGDRVVVPGREPEFVAVLRPGVGAAALGDDGAELRVGDHVDPRRGRGLAGREDDDVLAAVAAEAAQAVEERQVALRELGGGRRFGPAPRRLERAGSALRRGRAARPVRPACPASSSRTTRATVCSSTRSSSDICSPRRTKMPPGLSTSAASGLAAIRSMIASCSVCR